MAIFATNGAKLYIGPAVEVAGADLTLHDLNTGPWAEIDPVESLGTLGDTAAEIATDWIGRGRTQRLKGTRNAGTVEVVAGVNYSNPGQIALLAAEKTNFDYAFKLVLNDAPPGGIPSERYFAAAVGSAAEAYDSANNVVKLQSSLWVNSNVVRVDPTGGGGAAPDNTALPVITGTAEEGETLATTGGTWTGSPVPSLGYQWLADGEGLPGTTGPTLLLTAAHVGKVISVAVSASNPYGTRLAVSIATSAVTS